VCEICLFYDYMNECESSDCPRFLSQSAEMDDDNIFERIVQSQGTCLPFFFNDSLNV